MLQSLTSQQKTAAVAILTLLAILIPLWPGFDAPGGAMDEGMLLVYPELIAHGKLPYRDFETFYGPGNLWMLAGSYAVFGAQIGVERSVGLLYRLLLAGGVFFALRRWSLIAAATGAVLTVTFLIPTRLAAFAWLGGVACVLWSLLILAERPTPWRAFLGGLLGALGLLYRVDLGLAVLASAAPLFLLLPARERWLYLAGTAAGMIPLGVLALLAGPQATLENLFTYPVLITNAGRRLPLSEASDSIYFLFFLHVGASLCNILAGFLACRRERNSRTARLFLALALLGIGLTHQGMQRPDSVHVALTAFLSIALLPVGVLILCQRGAVETFRSRWAALSAGVVMLVVFARSPEFLLLLARATLLSLNIDAKPAPAVVVRDRHFPRPGLVASAQQVASFIEANSRPGERLFIGTGDLRRAFSNDAFFYHLLPWLTPASYFLEMNPLSANRPNSRLASDVASADWLILNRAWDNPQEPNLSQWMGSDAPNEVVRAQFALQAEFGPFNIHRRRAAASETAKLSELNSRDAGTSSRSP
ncbi:MAG TPA: hypothetical protein VFD27_02395 [Chthoniobacteraceae bacterium]|nr:hypothetical protein [Chthoniobacteraceae bacterium]